VIHGRRKETIGFSLAVSYHRYPLFRIQLLRGVVKTLHKGRLPRPTSTRLKSSATGYRLASESLLFTAAAVVVEVTGVVQQRVHSRFIGSGGGSEEQLHPGN
jgi:hypothetical protein